MKIATFGAFISLLPGKDGLLHVSEVRKLAGGKRVENVEDVLAVGQKILVKITKIDDRGKLSLEPVLEEPADQEGRAAASPRSGRPRRGLSRRVDTDARPSARRGGHPHFRCLSPERGTASGIIAPRDPSVIQCLPTGSPE